jgi:hypothetical protein
VLEFGRCITSIRAEFGEYGSKSVGTTTSSAASAAATEIGSETSRRQFLGISEVDDVLRNSTPLAPDDDIIINW